MLPPLSLRFIPQRLAIVRLPPNVGLPWWAATSQGLLSVTRTPDETSIVCEDRLVPDDAQAERGFAALRVVGTLPFSATGVLASMAVPLADGGVSIFAISTFDTDYLLVRESSLDTAMQILREAGHQFSNSGSDSEPA